MGAVGKVSGETSQILVAKPQSILDMLRNQGRRRNHGKGAGKTLTLVGLPTKAESLKTWRERQRYGEVGKSPTLVDKLPKELHDEMTGKLEGRHGGVKERTTTLVAQPMNEPYGPTIGRKREKHGEAADKIQTPDIKDETDRSGSKTRARTTGQRIVLPSPNHSPTQPQPLNFSMATPPSSLPSKPAAAASTTSTSTTAP
jgi:hypothetical protein